MDKTPDTRANKGLQSVFANVFPIESADGNIVIEYVNYEIGNIKYSEDECFDKNLTFSVPIKAVFRLINRETGEIKEKDIYIGDFPLMTKRGTFIINGAERVVVNQIYKSPGVLFSYKNKEYSSKIVPEKGSWLEFIVDAKKDLMYVRIDSRRKVLLTMFLRALGMTTEEIINAFFKVRKIDLNKIDKEEAISRLVGKYVAEDIKDDEENLIVGAVDNLIPGNINQLYQKGKTSIKIIDPKSVAQVRPMINTLEKDDTKDAVNKAIKKIYSILHPGEAAPLESIVRELNNMFFSDRLYDLGEVGRYKLVLKLFPDLTQEEKQVLIQQRTLSFEDINRSLRHLIEVYNGQAPLDDVDHLGNRRVRNVNELIVKPDNKARSIKSRNPFTRSCLPVNWKTRHRRISSRSSRSFLGDQRLFGMSQLSQFMDQTNPISELTHKRRLSALGPGGLSPRPRRLRSPRRSQYALRKGLPHRKPPKVRNIGLIESLSTYAPRQSYGYP
jgi:DNA-directed RNA polymerase subunit beta